MAKNNLMAKIERLKRIEYLRFVEHLDDHEIAIKCKCSVPVIRKALKQIYGAAKSLQIDEFGNQHVYGRLLFKSTVERILGLRRLLSAVDGSVKYTDQGPELRGSIGINKDKPMINISKYVEIQREIRENYAFLSKELRKIGLVHQEPIKLDGTLTLAKILGVDVTSPENLEEPKPVNPLASDGDKPKTLDKEGGGHPGSGEVL